MRAFVYYEDGGVRHELAHTVIDLPDFSKVLGVMVNHTLTESSAIGKPVGVEFRSESWGTTWVTVDNIRLSVLAVPSPVIADAWLNGSDFKLKATNLVPGVLYHLMRDDDLSVAPQLGTPVESRTATSDTETFTDAGIPGALGSAFYRLVN